MPTISDLISGEIKREGAPTNDPVDKGGRTAFGISEAANPDLWTNGPPTEEQARARYQARYVEGPGFSQVQDVGLRAQLVDFGVTSGPAVAITKLQEVLAVEPDGVFGPETLQALQAAHPEAVSNGLVAKRVVMIGRIVVKNPSQLKFLVGWLDRATSFL